LGLSGGPWGPPQRGPRRVCVLRLEVCFVLFFSGFKQDSPGFLGDPQGCPRQAKQYLLLKKVKTSSTMFLREKLLGNLHPLSLTLRFVGVGEAVNLDCL
jgi:hypothetical protein